MPSSTPQPVDDSHQQLLDQMDIYYLSKPFRNPDWKPSQRRNKNTKQIISETQRKEASVLATQNNSGASTPMPATGATSDGSMTPLQGSGASRPVNMAQATQSLSTLVLERNLQKASNGFGGLGPAVTYTNIESAPSLHPAHQKHYCDITGLPSRYTDPKTKLRYYDREIFAVRLKGAIDNRIAEEQARQRQAAQSAVSTKPTPRRRPPNPNGNATRSVSKSSEHNASSTERGPDPSEFEPEFAIGDDESAAPSRSRTPIPEIKEDNSKSGDEVVESSEMASAPEGAESSKPEQNLNTPPTVRPSELPTEVRVKLRKYERLETKYVELLKAYRIAHTRLQAVEPFEASLREHTPLTSINDPGALVEYLNQINLKGDMVLDELKRVTSEREDLKKQVTESEKTTEQLQTEVAELKTKVDELQTHKSVEAGDAENKSKDNGSDQPQANEEPKEHTLHEQPLKSPVSTSSRITSFSLFSPRKSGASRDEPKEQEKETSEDLFSYDSEVPKLEAELEQRQVQIDTLNAQVESLKKDLSVARESTEGMVQSLESATAELHTLREAKDKFDTSQSELQSKIDRLEIEAQSRTGSNEELTKQITQLQAEITASGEQNEKLQEQIRDLERLRDEQQEHLEDHKRDVNILNEKLSQKDAVVKDLEDSLAMAKSAERQTAKSAEQEQASEKKLSTMQGIMDTLRTQLDGAEKTVTQLKQDIQTNHDEFSRRPSTKIFGFLDDTSTPSIDDLKTRDDVVSYLAQNFGLRKDDSNVSIGVKSPVPPSDPGTAASKKKNKKKKKGKSQQAANDEAETEVQPPENKSENQAESGKTAVDHSNLDVSALEKQISDLREELESKDQTIERLSKQIKDQEALQEEIETLRDDLLHQGEEHVEARDALKEALLQKRALDEQIEALEKEIANARKMATDNADLDKAHKDLIQRLEESQSASTALQKDLAVAEQLAAARFKDITDLKDLLGKAQPELRNLRTEVAELKVAKENLKNKTGELSRLEAKHEDLKSEMKGLGRRLSDKDSEVKELQKKFEQETNTRTKTEEELKTVQSDLRIAENKKKDALDRSGDLSKDLSKAKEECNTLRGKLQQIEEQVSSHEREVSGLKEEISLKTALHSSSQSLVQSLRDQTHEMNTQAREATSRAENLEEELAEAQRMLSERTREGQTMRMLLNQAESSTESRVREMKERMDAAIEERDRVEDESSLSTRRMMREVDEAKGKARDAQRALKTLEDEKDDLERRQKEWKRRSEDLEGAAERVSKELEEVQTAMAGLREALDESERQVREIEIQKADLRKVGDDAKERVDKLTKANKNLTEELKALQSGPRRVGNRAGQESAIQSSRTSLDSTSARSPGPHVRDRERLSTPTSRSDTPTGVSQSSVDYVYLKNVLLQFMEQRDKGHQRALIPVLGMLLHFDKKDEQKWVSAISAR